VDDNDEYLENVGTFFNHGYGISHLDNLVFNPFEINDDSNLIPLSDVDPDYHFYNTLAQLNDMPCNYFMEESFNSKLGSFNDNFSLLHFNVGSLPHNSSSFVHYLNNLSVAFSVIGLSETWLNERNFDLYDIDGYNGVHNYRVNRTGGGVSLMVKAGITFIERMDIAIFNECFESIFIEVPKNFINSSKHALIGVVYRPPNTDIDIFNDIFSDLLIKLRNERKICYLLGDFNINLLNHETHSATGTFLDILYANSFFPLITKPTRVQGNSATLIDNIFCNSITEIISHSGILCTDISDHFPVFAILRIKHLLDKPICVKKRIYSVTNLEKFQNIIVNYDWSNILNIPDFPEAFSAFHSEYKRLYDDCFPIKVFKHGYKSRKCWLSHGLKTSIKVKNRLYVISKQIPNDENICLYKSYKKSTKT